MFYILCQIILIAEVLVNLLLLPGFFGSHSQWMSCFSMCFIILDSKLFGKLFGGIIWGWGWLSIPLERIFVAFARPLRRYQIRTNFMSEFHVYKSPNDPSNLEHRLVHFRFTVLRGIALLCLISRWVYRGSFKILILVNPGLFSLFIYSPRTLPSC